ncbi:DoxX family protein [Promicromonospora soli]
MLLISGSERNPGRFTKARKEFQAQAPTWVPFDPDAVVVGSGIVEIGLGTALVATWKQPARRRLGTLAAAFFVAVFPGNIAQLVEHRDAFGLDTDRKRALRLLGQPALVAWALAATRK